MRWRGSILIFPTRRGNRRSKRFCGYSRPQVFGNYVDKYDISDAVEDGATVKIIYESRLAKVTLTEEGTQLLKQFDEELQEDEEVTDRQKAKSKWTRIEAIVGNESRVKNLASDIVSHFEARRTGSVGKAMIVAMSRRIAVDLYEQITALRPDWHDSDKSKGEIKVVMTASSSDGPATKTPGGFTITPATPGAAEAGHIRGVFIKKNEEYGNYSADYPVTVS